MRNTILYYSKQTVKQPLLYTFGILTAIVGYTHLGLNWLYERIRDWHIKEPTYRVPMTDSDAFKNLDPDPYLSGIARKFTVADDTPKHSEK
jgi:hypothetical protein